MAWFFRVLLQWLIISFFVCVPFLLPSLWPYSMIVSGIVVFGLLSFGIFDPAFAVRRALIWASMTVIAVWLTPPFSTIRPFLADMNFSENTLHIIDAVQSFLFVQTTVSWAIIAIIAILFVLELYRMTVEFFPLWFSKRQATTAPHAGAGSISYIVADSTKMSAAHTISITNNSASNIKITAGYLKFIANRPFNIEIYANDKMDEISNAHPHRIRPGQSSDIYIRARNCPTGIRWFARNARRLRATWLVDISATCFLAGDANLPSKGIRLHFVVSP